MIKIFTLEFITVDCCSCGVIFAIHKNLNEKLLETHKSFYCPNGHCQSYTGQTEAKKLKNELARERAAHDQTKADREAKEKQLNRVANGVCPCCKRSFKNLQRHMKTKHPREMVKL